jgi:hypothetical protein
MRKLLFLLPILLLSSCASLDFQIRTLHTANMYDGIYYNTPTRINSNFIFFQPNYYNNFWWNYSQTFPYNWNHFSSFGLTYNWRYNRWNSNQWLINPYYDQFRIAPLYTPNIVRNRGRRSNTRVSIPRTPVRVNKSVIRSVNTRNTRSDRVRSNSNIRTSQPNRNVQRTQLRTPQPIRRVQSQRTQVRQVQPKPVQRRVIRQTQPTRRTSNMVIKNKRNQ